MKITTAFITDTGGRATNQDQTGHIIGENAACFVVCDGVAEKAGGGTAAQVAKEQLLSHFSPERQPDISLIHHALTAANDAIRQHQRNVPELEKMATTIVTLFVDRLRNQAYWAHAGDSRLYLFRRNRLCKITTDHSLAQQLTEAGHDSEGVNSRFLCLALGISDTMEATFSEAHTLEDGDVFLLCTDGFWHSFSPDELEQTLSVVTSPEEWLLLLKALWERENRHRHPGDSSNGINDDANIDNAHLDNYSAIAIWFGSPEETTIYFSPPESQRVRSIISGSAYHTKN